MTEENEELAKALSHLEGQCDLAMLSSVENVTYVSGFEVPHPVGALAATVYSSPFALVSVADGTSWLAVSIYHVSKAQEQSRLDTLLQFDAFDHFQPADLRASYLLAVKTALEQAGAQRGAIKLGVEHQFLPAAVSEFIADTFPSVQLVEIGAAVGLARRTKTEREIGLLRQSIHVVDVAQQTLAELVKTSGTNEFDMFAEIIARMYAAAGREVPVVGELVTGPRTNANRYTNGPQDRVTRDGDCALMDISTRLNGYWSDCTNTLVIGPAEAPAELRKFVSASQDAFDAAVNTLRPGKRASDVWEAGKAAYAKHGMEPPHYFGHQIGTAVNEEPRLVLFDDTPLEANMVFCVEPGAYAGEGGIFGARSEKTCLVTDSGPVILSQFDWGIR
jgi:Xaa-Pro aminopeptidase